MLMKETDYELELRAALRHVSVLTPEYLVKGLDDAGYSAFEAAGDLRRGADGDYGFVMTNAVVQSLRLRSAPRNFRQWHVPSLEQVVLISAEDDFAIECMLDYWSDFAKPFKAVLYCGPFLIEGLLLSDEDAPPDFSRLAFRPIQDATVTYQLGGNQEILRVRHGVVHAAHLHGFGFED